MSSLSIPQYVSIVVAVLLVPLAARAAQGESAARYEAVFSDGRRVEGDRVSGWGEHPVSPRLDDTALFDAKRPLRWLRDRSCKAWSPSQRNAYIEFVGGDRLVGRIEGVGAGDGVYAAHLLVKPATPLHQRVSESPGRVRILPGRIERVVFRPSSRRKLHPGTLYYLDGRKVGFVYLRWKDQSVVLLLKNGTREVKISQIAEVHLPPIDPWQAYYQELATLSPACRSRMMRIETIGGLIATSSSLRFSVTADKGRHIVQPVWSLDPLWVPFERIRMRWSFRPEHVPLCRVQPASTISPPFLARYTNCSFTGSPLRSGADEYAWGFAVHAYSELRFPLPKCASAFRSRIGLDRIVGAGGCVRTRVYVGSTAGKPAYESPLLIGSKKTVDTGPIALKLPADGPRLLVLQADPADRDGPPGADPLNIRDKLDWLDPRIELDTAALQEQIRRQIAPVLTASPRWALRLDPRGVYTWTSHLDKADQPGGRRFWTMLQAGAQPLSLRREMTITPADKWLAVYVSLPDGAAPLSDTVTLNVGGRGVQPRKVPIRQSWQDRPAPLLFGLKEYQGRKITLELTQAPGGKPLHWHAVSISPVPPAAYRLVDIMEFVGKTDMKVSRELGLALQSGRMGRSEKLAALEISQLGGVVNFRTEVAPDELVNVLLDANWTGGDKTFIKSFTTFKRIPSLKMLLVTEKSGVSAGAIAKLQAEMPKLTVRRFVKRTPSPMQWTACSVTWRNHTGKKVIVLFINERGKLQFSRWLEAGQVMHRSARLRYSYEAHYARKDYTHGEQFRDSLPLTSFLVTDGAVWDIRP